MKVIVYREYEVDTDHLDPSMVKIKSFVEDEAYRMLVDDFINGDLLPCDFNVVAIQ
jgi:hypothetical protein